LVAGGVVVVLLEEESTEVVAFGEDVLPEGNCKLLHAGCVPVAIADRLDVLFVVALVFPATLLLVVLCLVLPLPFVEGCLSV